MHGTRMIIASCGPGSGSSHLPEQLSRCGARVAHSFALIPGVAAEMTPESLRRFLDQYPGARVLPDRQRQLPPMPFGPDDWAEVTSPGSRAGSGAATPHTSPLAVSLLQAEAVHGLGIDGSGVRVCIIDTGVDFFHPDLQGTAILGPDSMPLAADFTETDLTDNIGHGTAVAGCVAAQARRVYGVAGQPGRPAAQTRVKGIAPGARLMSAKVFDARVASGYDSTIIAALEWAAQQGAQIVNLSLGGVSLPNDGTDPLAAAVTALRQRGILVVVSAGNEGSGIGTLKSPGSSPGALTVGASTMFRSFAEIGFLAEPGKWTADQLAGFSSLGPSADGRCKPEILAPGAYDWGLAPTLGSEEGQYVQLFGGTSQAAPLMAGAAALVYQAFHKTHGRYPTPDEAIALTCSTALDLGLPAHLQGAGRVDALQAVQAAMGERSGAVAVPPRPAEAAPGQTAQVVVELHNPGSKALEAVPAVVAPVRSKPISSAFHGEVAANQSPQQIHFTVAEQTGMMQVSLDWPSRTHGPQAPRLLLAVYDPEGRFINYQSPSPTGDYELGRSVDTWVAHPMAGRWTARVALRGGDRNTVQPYTLSIRAFQQADWDWVETPGESLRLEPGERKELRLTVRVPEATPAGTYTGHLRVSSAAGGHAAIPLAVLVPVVLESGRGHFTGQFQHGYQGSWGNGDWLYHDVEVPDQTRSLITSLQWPDVDNAVEFYLIDPAGHAVAGRSNTADIMDDGSSHALGAQILFASPRPGRWRLLLHSFAFCGRGMPEPYFGVVETGRELLSPRRIDLQAEPGQRAPVALHVRNPGRMPLTLQASALSMEPRLVWRNLTGQVKSGVTREGAAEGSGHIGLGRLEVPLGSRQVGVILTWDQPEVQVSLTLYDPVSRRITAAGTGGRLMLLEPEPMAGEWRLLAGVTSPEVESRTVNLSGASFLVAPTGMQHAAAPGVTVQPGGEAVLPVTLTAPARPGLLTGRLLVTSTRGDYLGEVPFRIQAGEESDA